MPTYNYELADSAHEMFENGFEYLTATDLASYHIKRKSLGREIVSGIEKRLPRIKHILEKEHGLLVHGINDHFYDLPFLPVTLAEAFKSIPGRGPGQTMSGIRVVNGDGYDLLYQASVESGINKGAGKLNADFARITQAVLGGQLTEQNCINEIEHARRKTLPKNATPKIKQLITKKLVIGGKKKPGK